MKKIRTIFLGYSLLEMLLVMAIIVVLGSMGIGGFIGFRETALARENVETLKQDILLAQHKSMLLERSVDDSWVYGVGIDFSNITRNEDLEGERRPGAPYRFFKWCSPFPDFGNTVTRSKIPGWMPGPNIGDLINIGDVLGRAIIIDPISPDPVLDDDDDGGFVIEPIPVEEDPYVPPPTEPPSWEESELDVELPAGSFANGILPVQNNWTTSCIVGQTSLVEITGEFADKFIEVGEIYLLSDGGDAFEGKIIQYIVFEALTGRAFIYDEDGRPINYDLYGNYTNSQPFDIVMTRKRSSKFDVITVYPKSGAVVHHLYDNSDIVPASSPVDKIVVDGETYKRYTLLDEIGSYRD